MQQSYKWHLNKLDGKKMAFFLLHGVVGVLLTNLSALIFNTDFSFTYSGVHYVLTPYVVVLWGLLSKTLWQAYQGQSADQAQAPATEQVLVQPVEAVAEAK